MTLHALMSDLRSTKRWPTDAEVELIVREGTMQDVGDALSNTCALKLPLRAQYRKLYAGR